MPSPPVPWLIASVLCLLCLVTGALPGASVAELLRVVDESIAPDEREEPGSTKRAEAIAGLLEDDLGLSANDLVELRLSLADAWTAAGAPEKAQPLFDQVLGDRALTPVLRERAGLGWVAAWQELVKRVEKPAELPTPETTLAAHGDLGPLVAARSCSAEAERQLALKQPQQALPHLDRALALLKPPRPVAERVPVYVLRLLAMEQAGLKAEEIQAWLAERAGDPALVQVTASALTSGQKLVGRPAPPLKGPRVDGKAGEVDLSALRGKPVLIAFFATWNPPGEPMVAKIAALIATYQARGLQAIGVSLDTKDSAGNLPGFLAKHAIAFPVIGDALGWDSEIDDAFHVESIPAAILVAADGSIIAVDLVSGTPEETAKALAAAVERALGGKPVRPAAEEEAIP
ncbi:MAG: TlpA family protein disulfide reductase [Planctomycetes bacterium]|nr:TlpA family protein disulfide reductase [Planctomycetota bacterium]